MAVTIAGPSVPACCARFREIRVGTSSPSLPIQLPLGIRWDDTASLESFYAGDNRQAVAGVERLLADAETSVYLHGPPGTGKSHLLQAAARACSQQDVPAAYLPLGGDLGGGAGLLDGMEQVGLVALDDVHAVAGDPRWETALFHAFNRMRDAGTRLLVAAADRPEAIGLQLPDLLSRLQWGLMERLHPMDDDQRLAALRHRARLRGLDLPADAGQYLIRRQPRDMRSLFGLLEALDRAALAEQRRLTVPFIRKVLGKR